MLQMKAMNCILIGLTVLVAASGCGRGDRVDVYPVKGRITFNGRPMVGGGSIAFLPTGDQKGKAAGGTIAADGTYELTTYEEGDGSMVGDFRVIINQTVVDEPETDLNSDAGGSKGAAEPVVLVPKKDRIPFIYSDPANTPLKARVEADSNEIDFPLERR